MPNTHFTTYLVGTVHFMQYSKEVLKYNNVADFEIYILDYGISEDLTVDDTIAHRDAKSTFDYSISVDCSFYAI